MKQDVDDFVEKNVAGEPLNEKTVAWAIRKYLRSNFEPPDKRKIGVYEQTMYTLAQAKLNDNTEQIDKTLEAMLQWAKVRTEPVSNDEFHQRYVENETFYNLIKI